MRFNEILGSQHPLDLSLIDLVIFLENWIAMSRSRAGDTGEFTIEIDRLLRRVIHFPYMNRILNPDDTFSLAGARSGRKKRGVEMKKPAKPTEEQLELIRRMNNSG